MELERTAAASRWRTFSASELPPSMLDKLDFFSSLEGDRRSRASAWSDNRVWARAIAGGFTGQGPTFNYTTVIDFDLWARFKWEQLGFPVNNATGLPFWKDVEGSSLYCYPSRVIYAYTGDLEDPSVVGPLPLVMNYTCDASDFCAIRVAQCTANFYCKVGRLGLSA